MLCALLMATTALVVAEEPAYLMPTNPPALVQLAWDASPSVEVTGYYIYYGCGSRQYTNKVDAGPALTVEVTNLVRGAEYFFAATAYTETGLESDFSEEVSCVIQAPPRPPENPTATNLVVRIEVETASSPGGPWTHLADLGTVAAAHSPAFYRGVMRIDAPQLAMVYPKATSAAPMGPPPVPGI